jgi:RimJ/RimL family protein N-acetyltransferase
LEQSAPPTLIDLPAELRGPRVLLRPYRPDDAEQLFAAIDESREHLRPWMPWVDQHRSVADTRDYCVRCAANWLLRTDLALGVYDAVNGHFLGATGLHEPNWTLRSFEIGYWLRTSSVGQGFMTESVRVLVEFAFDHLQARRVEINCDVRNEPSRNVAERAGLVLEGRLRNAMLTPQGEPGDWLVFSLIPEDWERLRAGSHGKR